MPEPNWSQRLDNGVYVLEPYPRFDLDAIGGRVPGTTYLAFQLWVDPYTKQIGIIGTGGLRPDLPAPVIAESYLGGFLSCLREVAEYFNELDVHPDARPTAPQGERPPAVGTDLDDLAVTTIRVPKP